jgi:hypothetical protein
LLELEKKRRKRLEMEKKRGERSEMGKNERERNARVCCTNLPFSISIY